MNAPGMQLEGRVAIVTGAGRGLGRAWAERLGAYGVRVLVNDHGADTAGVATPERPEDDTVATIRQAGGSAIAARGDISDTALADSLTAIALDTWGRLDIVVANAGFGRARMSFNLSDDDWDAVIGVHLRGTFSVARPALAHWRATAKADGAAYGRLITTSSGLLLYGGAGQSNYVAAKAGVVAFTEAVATEIAQYGDVTANAIMPSANTRLARIGWRMERSRASWQQGQSADRSDTDGGTFRSALEGESPTEGFDPTDPAHTAEFGAYLASPHAAWISGQTFQVRGGTIEHISTWSVDRRIERRDRGWTVSDLRDEMPRLFETDPQAAGPKPADPPPSQWRPATR